MSDAKEFLEAVRRVSYYRAGEGEMWRREQREARQAEERLKYLWADMVAAHGEDETRRIADSIPNLLFLETHFSGGKA
jgi:hypothetical protein